MNFVRTKRLTFALIAQVVFCMAFAPVVGAASQAAAAAAQESSQRNEAPHGSEAAFQAARDAANLRPDDDAERAERAATNRRRRNASRGLGRIQANFARSNATHNVSSEPLDDLSIPSPGVPGAGAKAPRQVGYTSCITAIPDQASASLQFPFACLAFASRITAIREDRSKPAAQEVADPPTRTLLIASVQPTGPPRA